MESLSTSMVSVFKRATDRSAYDHWELGFKQFSFHRFVQMLRVCGLHVFNHLPLYQHAVVPSSFRIQVGWFI